MASIRALPAALVLLLLTFYLVDSRALLESETSKSGSESESSLFGQPAFDCGGACEVRCSRSSRPNLCKRACRSCCVKCQCVPPGTYGNYNYCPCYAAITTRGGKPKCP